MGIDNSQSPIEPTPEQRGKVPLPARRPRSVTLLQLGVLILTAINLLRLVLSLRYWHFLASWPGVSPIYMALTGAVWTLGGLLLSWGLWKVKSWAPMLMRAVALTYALYYWLDHIFIADHPVRGAEGAVRALLPMNWMFAAGVTVLCLAFVAWALERRKVKSYFGLEVSEKDPADRYEDDV